MGNLALHSAEEPDNLRATTGTVEVPTERDNNAAIMLGARPIQQHEPAARHNGAQRGATANIDGAPVYVLHMAESPVQQAQSLPRYNDSPSLFDPETPEGATRVTKQLFGAIEESPGMTSSFPDSAYASRPMESDAAQSTTPALSEYQTPSTSASASTLAPSPTTERAVKPELTPELPRKGRRASPSPEERHRSQTKRETAHDDDGYGREVTAPRRKAQSTPSTRKSRGSSSSKSSTPKGARERLQWNDIADSNTEENGSSIVVVAQ